MIHFIEIFRLLSNVNLKIYLEKCSFIKPEVKVLGHQVSKQGIQLDPKKVEVIQQLTPLKDVTGVKSSLVVIIASVSLSFIVHFWQNLF